MPTGPRRLERGRVRVHSYPYFDQTWYTQNLELGDKEVDFSIRTKTTNPLTP